MSSLMLFLQTNYKIGMPIVCAIVLIIYIIVSLLCIKSAKSRTNTIYARGMIPIIQLSLFRKGRVKTKPAKVKTPVKEKEVEQSNDDDLFSDMF